MAETSEERLRDIINRLIVQPKLVSPGKGSDAVLKEAELSIRAQSNFVLGFIEMHTNYQIQEQQRVVQEQIQQHH